VPRPNEFSQPDYRVIYKDPDGASASSGGYSAIMALPAENGPGSGAWTSFKERDAPSRTRDRLRRLKKPRPHGEGAGIQRTCRLTGHHQCGRNVPMAEIPRGRHIGEPIDGIPTTEARASHQMPPRDAFC
jgi:hypothetical protein